MRGVFGMLLLAALAGCGAAPAPARRPNVLLVVIDTLRADRLGVYGNTRGLTPFLDELAARSHVVERVRAQAPWTNPSVASIFTSRYQSQHRIVDYRSVLVDAEVTLAEALKANGYVTGAFSANGLIGASLGFAQGFDQFSAHLLVTGADPTYLRVPWRADRLGAEALEWLATVQGGGAPIFLYLHLMEPHAPYAPPPELLARLRGARPPLDLRATSEAMYVTSTTPLDEAGLQDVIDAYDASVMAVDGALRRFFAALEQRGFLDDAVVVVTADHGEEFQEHGARGHGRTLYDEVIHIPLLVFDTAGQPGVVEDVVSSVDIAPTVLQLVGVPIPATFEGRSFAPALDQRWGTRVRRGLTGLLRRRPESAAYSEHLPPFDVGAGSPTQAERSLVLGDLKVIRWSDGVHRFFDLDIDPAEQEANLVDQSDRVRVEQRFVEAEAEAARNPSPAETLVPDERVQEALKALGYVE
jgi:arylsulfatase A-like enzyme